jgi:hypothetical protein
MKRRPFDRPDGWLFSGKRYRTEAEYQQARAASDERRDRLVRAIMAERGDPEDES